MNLLLVGGRLCLDFCNTMEYRGTERQLDFLKAGYPALVSWSEHVKILDHAQAERLLSIGTKEPRGDMAVAERAFALRDTIYKLFVEVTRGGREAPGGELSDFNKALAEVLPRRRLVSRPGSNLVWEWLDPDAPDAMIGPILLSALEVLTTEDLDRVRQCPGCGWLFLDQSRNHSRTWCDMRYCGNRAKAQRHSRKNVGSS